MTIKTTIKNLHVCLQKGNYKLYFYLDNKSDEQEIIYCCKGKEIPFIKIFNSKVNHLNEVIGYSTSYTNETHYLTEQEKQDLNDLINEWAKFDVDEAAWQQIKSEREHYKNIYFNGIEILIFILFIIGTLFIIYY